MSFQCHINTYMTLSLRTAEAQVAYFDLDLCARCKVAGIARNDEQIQKSVLIARGFGRKLTAHGLELV